MVGELGSEGGHPERRPGPVAAGSSRHTGRTVIGAVLGWAALGLLLGAVVGFFLIRPSDADVRHAVWTLVPSDAAVIETTAGGSDYSPFTIPYHAQVRFDLEQAGMDERVELVRRGAEDNGWRLVSQQIAPAATVLSLRRAGLHGEVAVFESPQRAPYDGRASVERDRSFARLAIGGGAGVGAAIGATAAVVARCRSS
ncbi:MAG: hypothetical protein M3O70_24985 [Actinomycetota bacterium]|nr:hypothetical protein [Actinomycetota bacterium]